MEGFARDSGQPMSLTLDYDLFASYLEDSDLSDRQKLEFVETLCSIIVAWVDLGFGIHPLQQACGEDLPIDKLVALDSADMVELQQHLSHHTFSKAADRSDSDLAEGCES